ncbi:putative knottin, scorpion toxin, defensin, plant, knottin, scorpion toxin-like superfamily [Helianthus debilis subsp. tardiflorus]
MSYFFLLLKLIYLVMMLVMKVYDLISIKLKTIAGMVVTAKKGTNKVCERRSKTWSGYCGDSKHCDQQCREWEGAAHGACHRQGVGRACFCYFNC